MSLETNGNNDPIYDILEDYFRQHRKDWDEDRKQKFYDDMASSLHYRKRNLLKQLREDKKGKKRTEAVARQRFEFILAAVYWGIPHHVFGLDNHHALQPGSADHFRPAFLNCTESTDEDYVRFVIGYLNRLSGPLQVHDYLGRGDRDTPTLGLEKYFRAHGDIFRHIEALLKERGIEYDRILALHVRDNTENSFAHVSMEVLRQCSPELFRHMLTCLMDVGHERARFYVTSKPSRTYQFATLKSGRHVFIYEEQYRLREDSNAYPSFVTVNRTAEHKDWHNIYGEEINAHTVGNSDMYFTYGEGAAGGDGRDIAACFRDMVDRYRATNFEGVKPRAVDGVKRITNDKIAVFNKILGTTKEEVKREGWVDLPFLR